MKQYGLIGFPLSHSFSAGYFAQKFADEHISDAVYENFPLDTIQQFDELLKKYPNLSGLNVTIPYKEQIIPYLHELDKAAREVEAVNTIKFIEADGKIILKGYNTDIYGFETSISPYLSTSSRKALILGTGGASKAVYYVLHKRGIYCDYISRSATRQHVLKTYEELTADDLQDYQVIINTTPLGMYPNTVECPPLPYEGITSGHILFDLIYNPSETLFLSKGKTQGAITVNGLEMLRLQAEKSWKIWNS
jgi:shikimate dehydrogenase